MARLNFLDRFRPVGSPGASGSAGHTEDLRGPAAELAPVFAALASDVGSAQALVASANHAAEKALAEARVQASGLTAQARLDAVTERAQAAAAVHKASGEHDRRLMARARKEASTLDAAATKALDAAAQRVIEAMVADILGRHDLRPARDGDS